MWMTKQFVGPKVSMRHCHPMLGEKNVDFRTQVCYYLAFPTEIW